MIEFPVFVFDGYSVDIFRNMADFQNKIEPIDIKSDHFIIFDSKGNNLQFSVEAQRHLLGFPVETVVFQTTYPDYESFCEKVNMVYDATFQNNLSELNMTVQEIQEKLIEFYGFTH